jgi:type III pantothenate kinase
MFDVGNTELKMALAKNNKIIHKYRFSTNPNLSDDEIYLNLYNLVKDYTFTHFVVASVVPDITYKLKAIAKKHFFLEPLILEVGTKTGLKINADNPLEVGADIVACSVGSFQVAEKALVVDLGTAIKYLYVANNTLTGVVISPGIEISLDALTSNTALLPKIDLKVPKKILGTNTVNCMQSGVVFGTAAQIDGLIERIKLEVNSDFKVIITGGLAELILPVLKTPTIYKPYLVFEGLLEILAKNI